MDFVFTTTQTSNDFVFDSSNDTFTDLTFQGGTYAQGIQGEKGETGEGVPTGGTTNQALTKTDGTDYNTQWSTVDKSFVGLGNVDNTSDADKPVSTAQQTALDGKFTQRTITGTANQITVTNGDGVSGNPTLSTPQNIHTGASPTFAGVSVLSTILQPVDVFRNSASGVYSDIRNTEGHFSTGTDNGTYIIYDRTDAATRLTIDTNGHVLPGADSTQTLGSSALYWSNTYTDRLYLNSTAYLDGATAGLLTTYGDLGVVSNSTLTPADTTTYALRVVQGTGSIRMGSDATANYIQSFGTRPLVFNSVGNNSIFYGLVGFGGSTPTHTLTLPSTATGIAIYNTADTTTNYERVRQYWSSNVYTIAAEKGGTGTDRAIRIGTIGATFYAQVNPGSAPAIFQVTATTGNAVGVGSLVNPTFTSTGAGTVVGMSISPIMTTGGTNGYTALLINPTETTTGSGAKLLIDAQVGGVSKFKVDNTGTPELGTSGAGIVMKSPDGTRYRVTVANGGTLTVAAA